MKRAVGLLGGTFDPIHVGHINLALELKERAGLDEVWFVLANVSPLRTESPPLSYEARQKLLELAIAPIPDFSVCSVELERPPPSYTIDTIQELKSLHPNNNYTLFLGEDALLHFDKWKDSEAIVAALPFLIGSRRDGLLKVKCDNLLLSAAAKTKIKKSFCEINQLDISATEIRKRLKQNLYCGHLLSSKVLDFILEHQLYF